MTKKLLLTLVSTFVLSSPAFAVLDSSPIYCPQKDSAQMCGVAIWPAVPKANWLKDNWTLSHHNSANVKDIVDTKEGLFYADLRFVTKKRSTLNIAINEFKTKFLKAYPKGTFNILDKTIKSEDGSNFVVYQLNPKSKGANIEYIAFLEGDAVVDTEISKKVAGDSKKAIYVFGIRDLTTNEAASNLVKFKEFLRTFSVNSTTENAAENVANAISELLNAVDSECAAPKKEDDLI